MAGRGQAEWADDFHALVMAHRAAFYRLAYRLTGNSDDAEDLVQETLIEAFEAFPSFRIGTHFDRWVYRIMTRTYIDTFRRNKHRKTVSLDELAQDGEVEYLADACADPQEHLEAKMSNEALQAALNRLPPDFRAVVVLCDAQGLSYEEASRALGCPVGTIRSRLHRAREQLRTLLRPLPQSKGK